MSNNRQQEEAAKMLIEAMKAGTAPWLRPWSSSNFPLCNGVTGHEYRGINLIRLLTSKNKVARMEYVEIQQIKHI
jgi:antirestriction protein ArdC